MISQNSPRQASSSKEKHIKISINGLAKQQFSISIIEETQLNHKIKLLDTLNKKRNPLAELVKIALILNPREFELPEGYIPEVQFPGTSKKAIVKGSREARASTYSVKRAQEMDRNNCPLILRTCFFCKRGCRKAPLIHCDYCPLVYHADCIDPPLTTLPNTRWMCPNHVEPIAEERLLSSSSYYERVKLWNHFSRPIDQEVIKISFLDKVHDSVHNNESSSDDTTRLIGCIVPTHIKEEYKKFMAQDLENIQLSNKGNCHHIKMEDQMSYSKTDPLRQMIESSELLERKESSNNLFNDIATVNQNNGFPTASNDCMIVDEQVAGWVEFVESLSNQTQLQQRVSSATKSDTNSSNKYDLSNNKQPICSEIREKDSTNSFLNPIHSDQNQNNNTKLYIEVTQSSNELTSQSKKCINETEELNI